MEREAAAGTKELGALPLDVFHLALTGDLAALRQAVAVFTPLVQTRVFRALKRHAKSADQRDVRQEIEDLTQSVLGLLFADEAKILRMWDPSRGMSLRNYVGLVSEREAAHILKSGRRTPWALTPTEDDLLEPMLPTYDGPEAALASKDILDRVWERLEAELSPKGIELLRRLVVDEQSVETVSAELGMTIDAVYAWKGRLGKRLRALAIEFASEEMSESDAGQTPPLHRVQR